MANDFSADSSCKALWRFEPGALTTDGVSSNTWTNTNCVSAPFYWEGSGAVKIYDSYLTINNADLAADFPLKSGDATKVMTLCFWMRTLNPYDYSYRYIYALHDYSLTTRTIVLCLYNGQFRISIAYNSSGSVNDYDLGLYMEPGAWNHITLSIDGVNKFLCVQVWSERTGLASVYLNLALTNVMYVSDPPLRLGDSSTTTGARKSYEYLDEMIVFNRLLNDWQIAAVRKGVWTGVGPTLGSNNFSSISSLCAQYRFESGALTTDSKGTNTLTASASSPTSATSPAAFVVAEGSGSARFTRASSQGFYCVDASLAAGFPFKNGDSTKKLTVCAWFKSFGHTGSSSYYAIAAKWNWGSSKLCWTIGLTNTDQLYLNTGYGSGTSNQGGGTATPVNANQWYHVAAVLDGVNKRAMLRVYCPATDRVFHIDTTYTNETRVTDAAFTIGCEANGAGYANYFNGLIDEVLIFNDTLSIKDIDAIRNGSFSGSSLDRSTTVESVTLQAAVRYPNRSKRICIDPINGSPLNAGQSFSEALQYPSSKAICSSDKVYVAKTPETALSGTATATQDSFTVVNTSSLSLVQDDVLRIGSDDTLYSIYSCAGLTIQLWRPYRGSTGSGKQLYQLNPYCVKGGDWTFSTHAAAGATTLICGGIDTETLDADGFTVIGGHSLYQPTLMVDIGRAYDISRFASHYAYSTSGFMIAAHRVRISNCFCFVSGYLRTLGVSTAGLQVDKFVAEHTSSGFKAERLTDFEVNDLEVFACTEGIDSSEPILNGTFRRLKIGNCTYGWEINSGRIANVKVLDSTFGDGAINSGADLRVFGSATFSNFIFKNSKMLSPQLLIVGTADYIWGGKIGFEHCVTNSLGLGSPNFCLYGSDCAISTYTQQSYAFKSSQDSSTYRTAPPSLKVEMPFMAPLFPEAVLTLPFTVPCIVDTPITIGVYLRKNTFYLAEKLPTLRVRYSAGSYGTNAERIPPLYYESVPYPYYASASSTRTSYGGEEAYHAFDAQGSSTRWAAVGATGWLKLYVGASGLEVLSYALTSRSDGYLTEMPSDWTVEGSNDNSSWTTLDTRTDQVWTSSSQTQSFTLTSTGIYSYYRLNVTANGGSSVLSVPDWVLFYTAATSGTVTTQEVETTMADVSDTWTQVSIELTPDVTEVLDVELLIYSSRSPAGIVWVDDFTVS